MPIGGHIPDSVLSAFCDESDDFGNPEPHTPFYLLTLVLHEQSHSVSDQIMRLEQSLSCSPVEQREAIHTALSAKKERLNDKPTDRGTTFVPLRPALLVKMLAQNTDTRRKIAHF